MADRTGAAIRAGLALQHGRQASHQKWGLGVGGRSSFQPESAVGRLFSPLGNPPICLQVGGAGVGEGRGGWSRAASVDFCSRRVLYAETQTTQTSQTQPQGPRKAVPATRKLDLKATPCL